MIAGQPRLRLPKLASCPHGGIAVNGQCVFDATHPPVPCACGTPICACRACVEAHKPTCRAKGAA